MKIVYYISMYFLFAVVFLNELFHLPSQLFIVATTGGVILLLLATLFMTRGFILYISLLSLGVGHSIMAYYQLGFDVWYTSMMSTLGIPILFVAIPMIALPIKHGNYLHSVESFVASKKNQPFFLLTFLIMIHLALSIVLNIGSIPTMQRLLEKAKLPKKFLARLYTAGYSSYMVFSPYDAIVNMVLLVSAISYAEYFFSALAMVVTITLVSGVFIKSDKLLLKELNDSLVMSSSTTSSKKLVELLVHIVVLISLAFIGEKFIPLSNQLYKIAVIIISYSLFWGLLIKATAAYKEELQEYSVNLLPFKTFLPFLITASFFGAMISHTPVKDTIASMLVVMNHLPLYFIIMLFIFSTGILSLVGVHMLITVTTLAMTVDPALIGLSGPAFALMLLTCWYISMSISPFVPFTVIIAETIEEKLTDVTFKYNPRFAIAMLFIAPLVIMLANLL